MKGSSLAACAVVGWVLSPMSVDADLVGHWKLQGDARDYSGNKNDGMARGSGAERGEFNGRDAYIEVPASKSLRLGAGDFSIAAWVYTERDVDDVFGDIIDLYDPAARKGVTLTLNSTGNGYAGQGNDRQVVFGMDNGRITDWTDCGRPNPTSHYISNSMLVYKGKLYVAATDGKDEKDWAHVYTYEGGQRWKDCGRAGNGRTTGVGPLVVQNGELYAVTWTYDWTRAASGAYDPGRMYRYGGGTNWIDCGQPSDDVTLNTICSYKGKLFTGGGPKTWGVFTWDGGREWQPSKVFSKEGERRCFPHSMSRYNGKLFTGYPGVYAFDGNEWTFAGLPGPLGTVPSLQMHSLTVYRGSLVAGTWPEAIVAKYRGGEDWQSIGRVGEDGTEVNALTVYNGKLYGGSIPRAEVCRHDGEARWTSLRRFHSATNDWKPGLPGKARRKEVNEWGRVTSLAIHDGKLFAGLGNCTSARVDTVADPGDVFGKVFWMQAGQCVSYDTDMGPGWKHIAAVRDGSGLRLYVNGERVAESEAFKRSDYDVTVEQPLRIGFGQVDYFNGKLSDVRVYNEALSGGKVKKLFIETKK
jgi:hypothetical protein